MVLKSLKEILKGKPRIDFSAAQRNDPCPCGSGRKFKACHFDREMARRREAAYSKLFRNPK